MVAAAQAGPGDVQLADDALGHRGEAGAKDVGAHVAQRGADGGDVDHETALHNLICISGSVSHTGFAGVALGGGLGLYYGAGGIPMNTITLAWMAGGDALFPVLRGANALRAGLAIAGLSTLAAVYPAFTASRLEPREALHHV